VAFEAVEGAEVAQEEEGEAVAEEEAEAVTEGGLLLQGPPTRSKIREYGYCWQRKPSAC
jgi:hypothetical protein